MHEGRSSSRCDGSSDRVRRLEPRPYPALRRSARIQFSSSETADSLAESPLMRGPIAKLWRICGRKASLCSFTDEPVAEIVQCGEPSYL